MISEWKKFFYFFLLSVIFHALVVFVVFLGDRERKTNERRITWVSFQSGGRLASSSQRLSDSKKSDSVGLGEKDLVKKSEEPGDNKGEVMRNHEDTRKQIEQKAQKNKVNVEQSNVEKNKVNKNKQDNKNVLQERKEEKTKDSKNVVRTRKEEKRKSFPVTRASVEKKQVVPKGQNKSDGKSGASRISEKASVNKKKVSSITSKSELAEIKSGGPSVSSDEIDKKIKDLYKFYDSGGGGDGGVGFGQSQSSEDIENIKIAYVEIISSLIKSNYRIPQFLKGTRLSCVVYISISKDGNIEDLKIEQSSGNPSFDSFVLKTIQDSVPFPNPPRNGMEFLLRFSTYD